MCREETYRVSIVKEGGSDAVRVRLQINCLDHPALMGAFADEVAEILEGNITLLLDLEGFIPSAAELLD